MSFRFTLDHILTLQVLLKPLTVINWTHYISAIMLIFQLLQVIYILNNVSIVSYVLIKVFQLNAIQEEIQSILSIHNIMKSTMLLKCSQILLSAYLDKIFNSVVKLICIDMMNYVFLS